MLVDCKEQPDLGGGGLRGILKIDSTCKITQGGKQNITVASLPKPPKTLLIWE